MVRRTYKKKENNNLRMSGKKSGVSGSNNSTRKNRRVSRRSVGKTRGKVKEQ
jgi:hypothetical protein